MENLTIDPDKQLLLINLKHSKTDQVGKGTILQIGKSEGVACPFNLSVRPLIVGPLFCHIHKIPVYGSTLKSNSSS